MTEFHMPAEWALHERCWMAWPCREGMWAQPEKTCQHYADVAHAIRRFEPLTMLVPPSLVGQARDYLGADIELFEVPMNDSWVRDSGPNFDSLRAQLEVETDARGRSLELLELPEAPPTCALSEKFCLSYVNFYIANGAVIAPAYGIVRDDEVRERLQSYFPDREIVQVRIEHIAEGGGGIHCITQQQPRRDSGSSLRRQSADSAYSAATDTPAVSA